MKSGCTLGQRKTLNDPRQVDTPRVFLLSPPTKLTNWTVFVEVGKGKYCVARPYDESLPTTLTFFILSLFFFFPFLSPSLTSIWFTQLSLGYGDRSALCLSCWVKRNRGQKRRSSKGSCVCVWNVVIKDLFSFFFHYRLLVERTAHKIRILPSRPSAPALCVCPFLLISGARSQEEWDRKCCMGIDFWLF